MFHQRPSPSRNYKTLAICTTSTLPPCLSNRYRIQTNWNCPYIEFSGCSGCLSVDESRVWLSCEKYKIVSCPWFQFTSGRDMSVPVINCCLFHLQMYPIHRNGRLSSVSHRAQLTCPGHIRRTGEMLRLRISSSRPGKLYLTRSHAVVWWW